MADLSTLAGGAFLIERSADPFTPEDFTEEQRQAMATAERFVTEEVLAVAERYEEKEAGLARELLSKCGELGLLSILTPEKYGGLELDLTSQLVVAEAMGRYESFSVTYGAHSGIGTLPLAFFGTDSQKEKYLPTMATGERMAAYCLSEPQAGSDALAARTKATLTEDGKHFILSGQKMWISNGGWADIYTVFAKVDGEKFTAFLVERGFEGVRPGAEERKMGIHGSSTTALYLDDVKVPADNVLGEIGRGHIIAFNILNLGRLKLGASCVGGAKEVLVQSIAYAKERKAFGKAIAEFGAIQQKLADMAIQTYVSESVAYRIGGLIDQKLAAVSWDDPEASKKVLAGIEEYAIECAIAKVIGSEALDFVADEGVQIHGGYGFHHDYAVERAYRDSRINRIFEGTNEINRLLSVGMLLKRAAHGRLALMPAVMQLIPQLSAGEIETRPLEGPLGVELEMAERAKKVALLSAGLAYQRFGQDLEQEQEVNMAIADILLLTYGAESALLRADKLAKKGKGAQAMAMARVYTHDALAKIAFHASTVLGACADGAKLEQYFAVLGRLTRALPMASVAVRREIAGRLLAAGKYVV
ncbi:MAG: acyl-CoA dehydrogenase family protein [Acidobacteria bacterium]|nr:acyl-CoA dehydrogenase family protein [Acidobacteriota bacterium]